MNYHEVYENVSIEQLRKLVRQTALENPKIKHDLTKVRICATINCEIFLGYQKICQKMLLITL